jgi:hypothetical protein
MVSRNLARREPSGALFMLVSTHPIADPGLNMEWTPPHPRRPPTAWEIHENRGKIRELDVKIADLQEQLEKLQRDRNVRASFLSSFRRLPAEILCEIVLHAVNNGLSPVRLSKVCASMREAVIGMKRLWTTIFLSPRRPYFRTMVSQSSPIMTISPNFQKEAPLLQE